MERDRKSNDLRYFSTLAATAPAFAAKAVIGDLPKGALEHAVERRLSAARTPLIQGFRAGLRGRGGGRAIGAALGVATAPIYLRGVQLASSKKRDDRAKGLALIGGASAALAAQKGVFEGLLSAKSLAAGARHGAQLGAVKALYKTPAALALGGVMGASRSEDSKRNRHLTAALGGAAVGGASRGFEEFAMSGRKALTRKSLQGVARAGAGGVAGGLFGGLVLSKVLDVAERGVGRKLGKEKSASALADIALGVGKELIEPAVGLPAVNAATKGLLRAGAPGRVLGGVRGGAAKQTWMDAARARQLAVGIREGIHGEGSVGWRGALSLGFTIPELRINREAGRELGSALRSLPEGSREKVLRRISKEVSSRPKLLLTPTGVPTPILADVRRGISKALGEEALYTPKSALGKKLVKPYQTLMYGGRGVNTNGLPKGWSRKKNLSTFRQVAPDFATSLLGSATAGVGAATGIPGLGLVGWHGAIGGIKGMAARLPAAKSFNKSMAAEALHDAVLPGLSSTKNRRARDFLYDFYASPATGSSKQLASALLAAGGHEALKRGVTTPVRKALMRKLEGRTGLESGARLLAKGAVPGAAGAYLLTRNRSRG